MLQIGEQEKVNAGKIMNRNPLNLLCLSQISRHDHCINCKCHFFSSLVQRHREDVPRKLSTRNCYNDNVGQD